MPVSYDSFDVFKSSLPRGCELLFIEQVKGARNLVNVHHPQIACYVLGAEDHGIPEVMMIGYQKVFIDTSLCLNVAVAGSIIMYDRRSKECK